MKNELTAKRECSPVNPIKVYHKANEEHSYTPEYDSNPDENWISEIFRSFKNYGTSLNRALSADTASNERVHNQNATVIVHPRR